MIQMLSNILMEKDVKKYSKFKLLTNLLVYTSKSSKCFEVSDIYFIEILKRYIDGEENQQKDKNILEEITKFYEEVISLYEEGKFGRFNFIVDKYILNEKLKKWLKEYKEEILSFFNFYIETNGLKLLNVIYSNKYFKVIKIQAEARETFLTPYIHPQEIVIRILLKGKIYYKEGMLLEENQYIIAGPLGFLGGWRILPDEIELILITIKKEFLEKFNIVGIERIIHTPLTLHQKELLKYLNKDYLEKDIFYITEIVTFFLHVNKFLPVNVEPLSYILTAYESNWLKLFDIIEENIKKSNSELETIVCSELGLNKKSLDEIMYYYEKTTFQKFLYNKKINKLIEEYLINKKDIDELLIEYNIKNKLILKYNLEKFYNLSIKKLKSIQNEVIKKAE